MIIALFSVPEGMAYAAIGGFPPAAGLYAGMGPTVAAGLLSRNVLMVTTLTSAIALTARSALAQAQLARTPAHLAALTLLVGLAMLLARAARIDRVLRRASPGARAGFALGIAVQIVAGALRDATGFRARHHNVLLHLAASGTHYASWSSADAVTAWSAVGAWALLHAYQRTRAWAVLGALVFVSVLVVVCGLRVPTVAALGRAPAGLPAMVLPDWGVLTMLIPGACAVALVALAQAAGISEPGQADAPGRGDDVVAQGVGNLVGTFFQALSTGGSVSRTGVAVAAGARTRWASVISGLVLAALLCAAGGLLARIALPAVGGLIIVVGARLAGERLGEGRRIWRTDRIDGLVLALTFAATTQLPLQDALLLGLALTWAAGAARRSRLSPAALPRPSPPARRVPR